MSEKRRGLGRGLGALIPSAPPTGGDRPVDVFFPGRTTEGSGSEASSATATALVERTDGPVDGKESADGVADLSVAARTVITPERATGANGKGKGSDAATATRPAPSTGSSTARGDLNGSSNGAASAKPQLVPTAVAETGPDLIPVPGAEFAELPVGSIRPNPKQPRQIFDDEAMSELVHSVREVGILQPVVVRRVADEQGEARYELIMGERRLRATQLAGLDRIPAIIRETSDDALLRDALLENLHRSQLNPLEEAAAYQQLLDDFGCTHEDLATRIGRSRPQISNTIRLLRLPPLVQRRVAAGILSAGHARALLGLEDAGTMERLAQRIVAEGLSVRAIEEIVALGDGPTPKAARKRPRAGSHTSELDGLAGRLGDRLETRVAIALGKNRGRLTIDFASVEDLNRILGLMAPTVKGAFQR